MRFVKDIFKVRTTENVIDIQNVDDIINPDNPFTFAEVLGPTNPVTKFYFDYDVKITDGSAVTDDILQQHEADVTWRMGMIVDVLAECVKRPVTFRIATRHGTDTKSGFPKISFRPFVSGIRVKYYDIPKIMRTADLEKYWFSDDGITPFWDASVYKSGEQLLSTVYNRKSPNDARVLLPANGGDVTDYIVQHVDDAWPILMDQAVEVVEDNTSVDCEYTHGVIEDLVACLGTCTSEPRNSWIAVGIFLKSIGEHYYPTFEDFSKKAPAKFDATECRKIWDDGLKLKPCSKPVTIGTLRFYAKRDNPQSYEDWVRMYSALLRSNTSTSIAITSDSKTNTYMLLDSQAIAVKSSLGLNSNACKHWNVEKCDDAYKLTPMGCCECLVNPSKTHDSCWSSCIMLGTKVTKGTKKRTKNGNYNYNNYNKYNKHDDGDECTVTLNCMFDGVRVIRGQDVANVMNAFAMMFQKSTATSDDKRKETPFMRLRDIILEYAKDNKLMKAGGHVHYPVPGCPCAYVQGEEYKLFLNTILKRDADYLSTTRLHRELVDFLCTIDTEHFPDILKKDMDMISFSNGVYILSRGTFIKYSDNNPELIGRVARHHIYSTFEVKDTPLFDSVLKSQFSDEVVHVLHVMLGRLMFKVGQLDGWQVMPYLVGVAGTGKSLILDIMTAMYATSSIGTLNGTQEKKFGLEGKHDKEVIIGRDLPKELSTVLEASLLQSMISGEAMSVPIKSRVALEIARWQVPLIMASNFTPDYLDTAGQIARRIVPFDFKNTIKAPDMLLREKILVDEIPAIMNKIVQAYIGAVRQHRTSAFYTWCPDEIKQSQRAVQMETDYVRRFLAAGPEENTTNNNRTYVILKARSKTSLNTFKDVFGKYMKNKHPKIGWKVDGCSTSTFEEIGYIVSLVQMCKGCGQKARGGADKCCPEYCPANRTKHVMISNMEIVHETNWDGVWVRQE
jgi:phage/plasmid-associated DNA primase